MTRASVRLLLISLAPALPKPKLPTLRQMEPLTKAYLSAPAGLTTIESKTFSERPKKSLLECKPPVLRAQPASSDPELSPLSDEEPVIAKKPAKKKRKVVIKSKVVVNEGCLVAAVDAAKPVEMTRSKRKVKAAVADAEAEILEDTQEDEMPKTKKRKRKPAVVEPVVYHIPDVEKKETTFKGKLLPQVSASLLMGPSPHYRSTRICTSLAPPSSHQQC